MKENAPKKIRFQTLRTLWLPLAIGVVTVAALAVVVGMVWKDYRTAMMDSQTRQMELVVQSTADSIRVLLEEYADRLDSIAGKAQASKAFRPTVARSDTIRDVWLENSNGEVIYSCYGLSAVCDVLITRTENISYWQYHSGDEHYLVMKKKAGGETACLVVDSTVMYQHNSGPGQTRNYGAERSKGEYLIILDSDCILPEGYFLAVEEELQHEAADAFGGPDRAHESFTDIQKAINYSMTSFFTTGGIRGGKKKMDKFYPRSFNMGVRQEVYQALGGFSRMRFGEDIDFSIRIFKGGYTCRLFPGAWVYHKRRTDFRKFFKQVHNSGIARINLYKKYPESLKLVHLLPAAFTLGVAIFLLGTPFCPYSLLPIALYALLVCMDSTIRNRSLSIGLYSVAASFIQLIGYGTGFLRAWWNRCILGKDEFEAFKKNFYK